MRAAEREVDSLKSKAEAERKRVEQLAREKDALNKQSTKAEGSVHQQVDLSGDIHFSLLQVDNNARLQEGQFFKWLPTYWQADMLRAYENEKKILEAEIAGYKANSLKHDKAIQVCSRSAHAPANNGCPTDPMRWEVMFLEGKCYAAIVQQLHAVFGCQALELEIEAATSRAQEAAAKVADLLEKIQLQDSTLTDMQKKVRGLFLSRISKI